ncbi:MAG: Inosine-5'-monophosphate dehydrogenase [Methanocella sp. PtaU1.Bin125]|nr:MAG: Inosine-5'-monophosphate dehydrogenase [Methanocella sp. PtaU1.Bin125]
MSKRSHEPVGELGENRRSRNYNSGRFESDLQRGQVTRDLNFKQRPAKHESGIMAACHREVVTVPPTTTIMGAARTMVGYGYRRLPVADPGTKRIEGICTVLDIINFLGGGDKSKIISRKYDGNMILAINAPITEIMEESVITVPDDASLEQTISVMIEKSVGGLPVVDGDGRIQGIITERDIMYLMSETVTGKKVSDSMSTRVITAPPGTTIEAAAKTMIASGFRRLPVVTDAFVCGIITATDIMRYLGSGDAFKKLVTGHIREAMSAPISTIMKTDIITAKPDQELSEVARLMSRNRIGCLPVIGDSGLAGIVTERDVLLSLRGVK